METLDGRELSSSACCSKWKSISFFTWVAVCSSRLKPLDKEQRQIKGNIISTMLLDCPWLKPLDKKKERERERERETRLKHQASGRGNFKEPHPQSCKNVLQSSAKTSHSWTILLILCNYKELENTFHVHVFMRAVLKKIEIQWGLCAYIIVHTILPPSPVIVWIELGGKSKWLPLIFGYHDVINARSSSCQCILHLR